MKTKLTVILFLLVFGASGALRAEEQTLPLDAPEVVQTDSPQVVPQDTPQVLQKDVPEVVGEQASTVTVGQSSTATVTTYDQLVAAIRKARGESQARVEQAVAQEKVRENWEIGKLIDEHVLQHKERADYGKQVLLRLANDLGVSDTELGYMLQFARAYPISPHAGKLTWSDYRELLAVNDSKDRDELTEKAAKENWNRDQIREEVKRRKEAKGEVTAPVVVEEKLTAKLGKVGTYRMVKATVGPEVGKMVIDLGFSNYYRTSRPLGFKEGAIIEALFAMPEGSSPSDKIKLSKRTADDLYTYRASIIEVLDGDTVKAVVDLGFGVRSVQTLRLRGIDAPEMVSKEGKEAKVFLEQMINGDTSHEPRDTKNRDTGQGPRSTGKNGDKGEGQARGAWVVERGTEVLVKTSKSDKYDRYLADVFINSVYVNQKLVERGFAMRVRDN
ncbi:MAG: DUF1016 N-terminal domain-containing protein [Candidatus Omnitrophota bacterium]